MWAAFKKFMPILPDTETPFTKAMHRIIMIFMCDNFAANKKLVEFIMLKTRHYAVVLSSLRLILAWMCNCHNINLSSLSGPRGEGAPIQI